MNDDYEQKLRDSVGDLLAQVAAGEISARRRGPARIGYRQGTGSNARHDRRP